MITIYKYAEMWLHLHILHPSFLCNEKRKMDGWKKNAIYFFTLFFIYFFFIIFHPTLVIICVCGEIMHKKKLFSVNKGKCMHFHSRQFVVWFTWFSIFIVFAFTRCTADMKTKILQQKLFYLFLFFVCEMKRIKIDARSETGLEPTHTHTIFYFTIYGDKKWFWI
jgi:hypothetical protein